MKIYKRKAISENNISSRIEKINNETEQQDNIPKIISNYKLFIKLVFIPPMVFINDYIFHLNIINGWSGYYDSKSKSFRKFLSYCKIIEKSKMK
ncbi:hypothetical protein [Chryseobacterium cheonjiense]|uniref:Uncharacterized protein n=1 Tax=Chryseobacterium cheonjiense TaxID=2728845 RepID=A0A7Y0A501_9FLAO|nr:hypothetical protein [Chryseobacterium cheonjiense]NML56675.1 hypothetical protein [Chryseobacterium cheonjiense]